MINLFWFSQGQKIGAPLELIENLRKQVETKEMIIKTNKEEMNALKMELRNLQGIRETVTVFEEQVNNTYLLSFSSIFREVLTSYLILCYCISYTFGDDGRNVTSCLWDGEFAQYVDSHKQYFVWWKLVVVQYSWYLSFLEKVLVPRIYGQKSIKLLVRCAILHGLP